MKKNGIIDKWIVVDGYAQFNSINAKRLDPFYPEYRNAALCGINGLTFERIDYIDCVKFTWQESTKELCIAVFEMNNKVCNRVLHFENGKLSVKAINEFRAKSLSELLIKLELEGFLFDEPCIPTIE